MINDEKIVSLHGGPVHLNHLMPGQLFAPSDVISGLPMDEVDELIVIARTKSGQMYLGASHNSSAVSLLLANATHFISRYYEPYG